MKTIITLLVLLLSIPVIAQETIDFKRFHKNFSQVEGNLYASKFETTNREYRAFMSFVKAQNDPELLRKTMVDTGQWATILKYNEPYKKYYFQHEAYDEYPVVNITRRAAELYCKWLTQEYNDYPKREFEQVRFRLPTEEEWKQAARGGEAEVIFPWGNPFLRKGTGDFRANFSVIRQASIRMDGGDTCIKNEPYRQQLGYSGPEELYGKFTEGRGAVLAPVESFEANPFELYNLSGNAAEYVRSSNRNTMGGAWKTTGYYLRIDADDPFADVEGGHPAIGFRVFMEVLEE